MPGVDTMAEQTDTRADGAPEVRQTGRGKAGAKGVLPVTRQECPGLSLPHTIQMTFFVYLRIFSLSRLQQTLDRT